jgi:hypothetical protein
MSLLHISRAGTSGLSVYRILRRAATITAGSSATALKPTTPRTGQYDIPLTDDGGDVYSADVDFTAAAGRYIGKDYIRSGATPAPDDYPLPGEEVYGWTGTALDSAAYYTTTTNVQRYGDANVNITGNLSNSGLFEDSSASVIDAIRAAYRLSNIVFLSANPRPDTFPVVSSIGAVNEIITEANTIVTWGVLRNDRDDQGGQRDNEGKTPGDRIIDKGLQMLRDLIAPTGAIPGVADEVTDADEGAGGFQFIPIVRDACTSTGDENARPLLWY